MERASRLPEPWAALLEEALAAEREARRLAAAHPPGSRQQAAGSATATRLREFTRDVRLAARRGRTNAELYRSVFEQLVPPIRSHEDG